MAHAASHLNTSRPAIHLVAPAGTCRMLLTHLHVNGGAALLGHVGGIVGDRYRVTGDPRLLEAEEDEAHGGRRDDDARAADITGALADDTVAAIVALRGGAWFTRVLPLIDFSVLDRRRGPVMVFGFSELTTLVNIVGAHVRGVGVYAMCPGFLGYGLKRYAAVRLKHADPDGWMRERFAIEFRAFFEDVVGRIACHVAARGSDGASGAARARPVLHRTASPHGPGALTARLVAGDVSDAADAVFVGGNLTVFATLIGSRFAPCVTPAGRWLVIEDLNEKVERVDRLLAHLTLAGFWETCAGVLIGDFHRRAADLVPAVCHLLPYHLPKRRSNRGPIPVLVTEHVGHVWPMTPLPLHTALPIHRIAGERSTYRIGNERTTEVMCSGYEHGGSGVRRAPRRATRG
ncbi:MAG: LD-carboxypeptidase [Phycisphaerae bacterium]